MANQNFKKISAKIRSLFFASFLIFALSFFILIFPFSISNAEMSSARYKIQSDSINVGGVDSASSARYGLEDTVGEMATGDSGSTRYNLKAGYRQMNEIYLAMTSAANVTMDTSLGGITGGISNGSTSFTVTTDDSAGYEVSISASSSPALRTATDSFADYVPAGANPDFNFAVADGTSVFGFSPEGVDIASAYKDDGAGQHCGIGGTTDTSGACWNGLGTSPKIIVERTTANHPSGTATTLKFRAGIGQNRMQLLGTYVATTTVTAIAL